MYYYTRIRTSPYYFTVVVYKHTQTLRFLVFGSASVSYVRQLTVIKLSWCCRVPSDRWFNELYNITLHQQFIYVGCTRSSKSLYAVNLHWYACWQCACDKPIIHALHRLSAKWDNQAIGGFWSTWVVADAITRPYRSRIGVAGQRRRLSLLVLHRCFCRLPVFRKKTAVFHTRTDKAF